MTEAYDRIKEGLEEALAVAKGERPAAVIHVDGHSYVPKVEYDALYAECLEEARLNGMGAERELALRAKNERLVRNAQTDAWLLAGYHRICERHGIAPSSKELMEAAREAENANPA